VAGNLWTQGGSADAERVRYTTHPAQPCAQPDRGAELAQPSALQAGQLGIDRNKGRQGGEDSTTNCWCVTRELCWHKRRAARKDVVVYMTAVERAGLRGLNEGQKVSFDVERGQPGKRSATNLKAG
jgi:cold shock CspA family protein